MVKSGISRNLSLLNTFQRSLRNSIKTTSNGKVVNYKVVENFKPNNLDILFVQNGQRMHPAEQNYCGGSCSLGTPKVGDVFDTNSFHTWIFRPSHKLWGSWRTEGSPRKVLEVPKSPWIKGASIPWPRLHLQHYILMGNPIFGGPQALSRKSSSLAATKEGETLIYTSTNSRKKKAKGRRSPMMPTAGESPAPSPAPPTPAPPGTPRWALQRLHRHLHHQLLIVFSGPSSHKPLYRPM